MTILKQDDYNCEEAVAGKEALVTFLPSCATNATQAVSSSAHKRDLWDQSTVQEIERGRIVSQRRVPYRE